jgi:4-amino-4-deoxy-L-arabinose transferase-like glycosyltransferase/DNA-binding beta-propeller fold protein YncE
MLPDDRSVQDRRVVNRLFRRTSPRHFLAAIAVVVIWAALVAANARWLALDALPPFPGGDPARHAAESAQIFRILSTAPHGLDALWRIAKAHTEYPPLVALVNAAAYGRFGLPVANHDVSRAAGRYNALFLLILLASVYGIAAGIGGWGAGLLATFLVATYPLIFSQARYFMLDMPVAAMAAFSVLLLIHTRAFQNSFWSLVFGVSLGLGMLTKQSFGLFLVGPTLLAAVGGVTSLRRGTGPSAARVEAASLVRWAANGLLVCGAFVATAGWWYIVQMRDSNYFFWLRYIANLSSGPPECGGHFLTVCGVTYYFRALNNSTSFGYLLLLAAALVGLARSRDRDPALGYVLAWAGVGYLLVSLPESKEPRYEMPLLPAVAVLTGVGLTRLAALRPLRSTRVRVAAVCAVVAFGVVQFAAVSFGISWLPEGNEENWSSGGHFFDSHWFPNLFFQRYDAYGAHPVREDWRTSEILNAIVGSFYPRCAGAHSVLVGVYTDAPSLVSQALYYAAAVRAPMLNVDRIDDTTAAVGRFGFVLIHVRSSDERPWFSAPVDFTAVARIDVPRGYVSVYRNRALGLLLDGPVGLAADAAGHLFVAETSRHCVAEFRADGSAVQDWGGEGPEPGQMELPKGITTDRAGNVYVADFGNNRIEEFDRQGRFTRTLGTSGARLGQLNGPWGIAVRPDGRVVVAEMRNDRIQVFDNEGRGVRTWGGYGGGMGQLRFPKGLTLDAAGNVYVVDAGNDRVEKFSPDGHYITTWGTPGTGDGQFTDPVGIWVDDTGAYVTDKGQGAARVQWFSADGRLIGVLRAGVPVSPMDVVRTTDGTLYCTDFQSTRLSRIGRVPPLAYATERP